MDAKSSRLVTAMLLGVVFGIIGMLLARLFFGVAYWPLGVAFLLHHAVMGLVIGASSLRLSWTMHGVFWGGAFGLFLAVIFVGTFLEPWAVFISVVVWGFLIELLTTKVLRRPQ